MTTLNAEIREASQKSNILRGSGLIPAVFYGFKKDTTPISVKKVDFGKVFKEVGESSTLTLKTPSGEFDALIHDIQHDPVTNEPIHVDFLAVDMSKEIEVELPLNFIGESPAVKAGNILVKVMHEINVAALPKSMPHDISVDIGSLKDADSIITIGDLVMPEGVRALEEPDTVVASVAIPKDEPVEAVPVDLSTIEVEKKGKVEVEGEEGEAPVEAK